MAGHVTRIEIGRSVFKMLGRKAIGKRPLGRPKSRWELKVGMDLK